MRPWLTKPQVGSSILPGGAKVAGEFPAILESSMNELRLVEHVVERGLVVSHRSRSGSG